MATIKNFRMSETISYELPEIEVDLDHLPEGYDIEDDPDSLVYDAVERAWTELPLGEQGITGFTDRSLDFDRDFAI